MPTANNLRAWRTSAGLTIEQLAEKLDISGASVSRIEKGLQQPRAELLANIKRVFNVPSIGHFFTEGSPVPTLPFGNFSVPLLDLDQARRLNVGSDSGAVSPRGGPLLLTDRQYSTKAFGMEISDVSMRPAFNPGDLAIFEPELRAKPNDFVLARNAAGDIVVRVYKDRGRTPEGLPAFDLVPLDDGFPTWKSREEDIVILGVWVERREYRVGG